MTRRSSRAAAQKAPEPPTKPAPARGRRAAPKEPEEAPPTRGRRAAKEPQEEPPAEPAKRGRGRQPAKAPPATKAAKPAAKSPPPKPEPTRGRGRPAVTRKKTPEKEKTPEKPSARSASRRGASPAAVEEPPAKRIRKPPRKLSPEPEIPKPRVKKERTVSSDDEPPVVYAKRGPKPKPARGRGKPAKVQAEDATSSGSDTAKPAAQASNSMRRGWGRRPKPPSDDPAPESVAPPPSRPAPTAVLIPVEEYDEPPVLPEVPAVVEQMVSKEAPLRPAPGPPVTRILSPSRQMAATTTLGSRSPAVMARGDVRPSEIPERGRPPKNAKNVRVAAPARVAPMSAQQVRLPSGGTLIHASPRPEAGITLVDHARVSPPKRGRPRKTPLPFQGAQTSHQGPQTVTIPITPRGRGRPKGSGKSATAIATASKDISPNRKRKMETEADLMPKKSKSENGNINLLAGASAQLSVADIAAATSVPELAQKLSEPIDLPNENGARQKVVQLTKQQQDQLQSTSQVQFVQQEGQSGQRVVLLSPKPVAGGAGSVGSPPPRVQLIAAPNSGGTPQIRVLGPGQTVIKKAGLSGDTPVRLVQMGKDGDKLVQILPSSPGGGATKVAPHFSQLKVVQMNKPSTPTSPQAQIVHTTAQSPQPQLGQILVKTTEGMKLINVKPAEPVTSKSNLIIPAEKSPTGQPIRIVQTPTSKPQSSGVQILPSQPKSPQKILQANPTGNIRLISAKGGQPTILTQEQAAKLLNQSGQQVRLVQQQPGQSPVRMVTVSKPQPQPVKIVTQSTRPQIHLQSVAHETVVTTSPTIVSAPKPASPMKTAPSILKATPQLKVQSQPQQILLQKPSSPIRQQIVTTQSLLHGLQSVGTQLAAPVKILPTPPQPIVEQQQHVPPLVHEDKHEEEVEEQQVIEETVLHEEPVLEDTPSTENVQQDEPTQPEPDLTDYVVVDMAEIPATDSAEVQAAQPQTPHSTDVLTNRTFLKNVKILEANINKDYTFSITSYNILADKHMRALGPHVYDLEDECLEQSFRHERLMKELEYLSADVVCLQECGVDYYTKTLEPAMKGLGYSGVMKKRLGERHPEGEATFCRSSRFTVVHSSSIALKDLSDQLISQCALDDSTKACIRQYLTSDEIILITKLRCNHTMKELTVGNVHIKWTEYKQLDLQCVQVACAVKELVNVAGGSNNAYVLCGDLNSLPGMAPYQLARDGYLNDESIEKLQQMKTVTMPDGSTQSLVNLWWQGFKHTSPNLQSAYLAVKGAEPDVTTVDVTDLTPSGCVDYIFCSPQAIQVLGVLETPTEDAMTNLGPAPNQDFPSDHVSVKAKLAFK